MRKFLTSLAAISLIGSLFLGAPAPVAAAGTGSAKVYALEDGDYIHADDSREEDGARQTYLSPAGTTMNMQIELIEDGDDADLVDTITFSLKNAVFAGTYNDDNGYGAYDDGDYNDDACYLDWTSGNKTTTPTATITAYLDCNAGTGADAAPDQRTYLNFDVVIPAGGSAVLTVDSAAADVKVFFFAAEDADDIYVGSGSLPAASGDGDCTNPDFSTNALAQGTIDEALFAALAGVDENEDTIIVCDGTYTYIDDIEFYVGTDLFDNTIHIHEATGATVKFDGVDAYNLLNATGANFEISGIEFEDGQRSYGGAINLENGDLYLSNTLFDSNSANSDGGAVRVVSGDVDVNNSDFTDNYAYDFGGAIHVATSGNLTVTDSSFEDNEAGDDNGGAISVADGNIDVESSYFENNSADEDGGAIFARYGNASVTDSEFVDNEAGHKGGAIIIRNNDDDTSESYFSIDSSIFDGNTSYSKGGAVMSAHNVYLDVQDSVFRDNSSDDYDGGAIMAQDDATIGFSTFLRNEAYDDGGAVYFDEHAAINDSRFVDNFSDGQGGAVFAEVWTLVDDTVFLRNRSTSWAGALSLGGYAWLDGAIFRANKSRRGGAIDSKGESIYLKESKFINNRATQWGGAVTREGYSVFGDFDGTNLFRGNQARIGDAVALYGWQGFWDYNYDTEEEFFSPNPLARPQVRATARVWIDAGATVWINRKALH